MFLDTPDRTLEAYLMAGIVSINPQVAVDWVDITATLCTPGSTLTNLDGVTQTVLVPAPGAGVVRKINGVQVCNIDTAAVVVAIFVNDAVTGLFQLVLTTLDPNDTLVYTDAAGWKVITPNGGIKTNFQSGAYLRTTIITAGAGFFTAGPVTRNIIARLQAGGGGGGGVAANAAGFATVGGGGSAGGYAEWFSPVTPNGLYAYVVGAAGAAGASGGGTGGTGGATTFTVGATTVTANGGLGGTFLATRATAGFTLGGASPAISTNGTLNTGGSPGHPGEIHPAAAAGISGNGGSCAWGGGGRGVLLNNPGLAGIGFGAGGSGGCSGTPGGIVVAQAGGAGLPGLLLIDEYT